MPLRAQFYIGITLLLAVAAAGLTVVGGWAPLSSDWTTFVVLLVLATVAQLFKVRAPAYQSYHVTLVFLMGAALLLHPGLYVLVVVASHIVEWVKERWVNSPRLRHWYLQPFNIATHILAGIAAQTVFLLVSGRQPAFLSFLEVVGILLASILYLLLNHLLIGLAISSARGVPLSQSGILDLANLQKDWALLLLGAVVAILWTHNPLWILIALSPAVLMYYGLSGAGTKPSVATK